MSEVRYTDQHEWVRLDGDEATVGITKYRRRAAWAMSCLSNCPMPAASIGAGGEAAVVESVKAASEVYAPVGGEVTAANAALDDEPAKVNADPEGEGWFFKLKLADKGEFAKLMDAAPYAKFVKGL